MAKLEREAERMDEEAADVYDALAALGQPLPHPVEAVERDILRRRAAGVAEEQQQVAERRGGVLLEACRIVQEAEASGQAMHGVAADAAATVADATAMLRGVPATPPGAEHDMRRRREQLQGVQEARNEAILVGEASRWLGIHETVVEKQQQAARHYYLRQEQLQEHEQRQREAEAEEAGGNDKQQLGPPRRMQMQGGGWGGLGGGSAEEWDSATALESGGVGVHHLHHLRLDVLGPTPQARKGFRGDGGLKGRVDQGPSTSATGLSYSLQATPLDLGALLARRSSAISKMGGRGGGGGGSRGGNGGRSPAGTPMSRASTPGAVSPATGASLVAPHLRGGGGGDGGGGGGDGFDYDGVNHDGHSTRTAHASGGSRNGGSADGISGGGGGGGGEFRSLDRVLLDQYGRRPGSPLEALYPPGTGKGTSSSPRHTPHQRSTGGIHDARGGIYDDSQEHGAAGNSYGGSYGSYGDDDDDDDDDGRRGGWDQRDGSTSSRRGTWYGTYSANQAAFFAGGDDGTGHWRHTAAAGGGDGGSGGGGGGGAPGASPILFDESWASAGGRSASSAATTLSPPAAEGRAGAAGGDGSRRQLRRRSHFAMALEGSDMGLGRSLAGGGAVQTPYHELRQSCVQYGISPDGDTRTLRYRIACAQLKVGTLVFVATPCTTAPEQSEQSEQSPEQPSDRGGQPLVQWRIGRIERRHGDKTKVDVAVLCGMLSSPAQGGRGDTAVPPAAAAAAAAAATATALGSVTKRAAASVIWGVSAEQLRPMATERQLRLAEAAWLGDVMAILRELAREHEAGATDVDMTASAALGALCAHGPAARAGEVALGLRLSHADGADADDGAGRYAGAAAIAAAAIASGSSSARLANTMVPVVGRLSTLLSSTDLGRTAGVEVAAAAAFAVGNLAFAAPGTLATCLVPCAPAVVRLLGQLLSNGTAEQQRPPRTYGMAVYLGLAALRNLSCLPACCDALAEAGALHVLLQGPPSSRAVVVAHASLPFLAAVANLAAKHKPGAAASKGVMDIVVEIMETHLSDVQVQVSAPNAGVCGAGRRAPCCKLGLANPRGLF